jgi:hypothetical protein
MGLTGTEISLIGGGVTGAITSVAKAEAIRAQTDFERRALQEQAKFSRRAGRQAIKRGRAAESQQRQRTKKLLGAQRTALAAQGIDIDAGSAAELQTETLALGGEDALTIRRNARLQALGFELRAEDLLLQRQVAGISGRARRRSTLLTGGLRFARGLTQAAAFRESKEA